MANHDNSDLFVLIELEILFDSILNEVRPPDLWRKLVCGSP